MPLTDAQQDAALDALGASFPSTGKWRLYVSNPALATNPSDVELASTGGYTPDSFTPSDWASAAGGALATGSPVSFGTSTAAYADVATYWGITGTTDADDLRYYDDLADPIEVDDSGTSVAFTPSISYADGD